MVLLPGTSPGDAQSLAERIRQHVAALRLHSPTGAVQTTISIGACNLSSAHEALGQLVTQADSALLKAKQAGRNRVVIAPSD